MDQPDECSKQGDKLCFAVPVSDKRNTQGYFYKIKEQDAAEQMNTYIDNMVASYIYSVKIIIQSKRNTCKVDAK